VKAADKVEEKVDVKAADKVEEKVDVKVVEIEKKVDEKVEKVEDKSEVKTVEKTGNKYAAPAAKKYSAPPPIVAPPPIAASVDNTEHALPEGWLSILDAPSGKFFFVEQATGKTTWNDPRTVDVETAPPRPQTQATRSEVPHVVGVPVRAPPPQQGQYAGQAPPGFMQSMGLGNVGTSGQSILESMGLSSIMPSGTSGTSLMDSLGLGNLFGSVSGSTRSYQPSPW
jgi:hypothetical protein